MAAERIVTVEISFTASELMVLAELRARLRLDTEADLIRVALWVYAHNQGIAIPPSLFAVEGREAHRARSTRNT